MLSAVDTFHACKRARTPLPADAQVTQVANDQRRLAKLGDTARPNNGHRVQAQVVLTAAHAASGDDSCVLRVLNTAELNKFLALLTDHHDGLAGARASRPHQSPLSLPDWLQESPALPTLNRIVAHVYEVFSLGEDDVDDDWRPELVPGVEWAAFVERVIAAWPRLDMPPVRPVLSIVRPRASVGSLVLWTGWHGNCPAPEPPRPCAAAFVDYAPRETFPDDLLARSWTILSQRAWQFGAGALECRHAGYNDWANKQAGRPGGFARLGDDLTETDRYLGGDSAATEPDFAALTRLLTAEQLRSLEDNAYLVVPPDQLATLVPNWMQLVHDTVTDLSEHLNAVVIRSEQLAGQRDFDLHDGADPRWAAVGGTCDQAQRLLGERFAMYKRAADGTRVRNAQAGGSLLTAQSAMGAATNMYDSPAQLKLQLRLFPVFAQLYGTARLVILPERCRIRTSGSHQLGMHTDTCVGY